MRARRGSHRETPRRGVGRTLGCWVRAQYRSRSVLLVSEGPPVFEKISFDVADLEPPAVPPGRNPATFGRRRPVPPRWSSGRRKGSRILALRARRIACAPEIDYGGRCAIWYRLRHRRRSRSERRTSARALPAVRKRNDLASIAPCKADVAPNWPLLEIKGPQSNAMPKIMRHGKRFRAPLNHAGAVFFFLEARRSLRPNSLKGSP